MWCFTGKFHNLVVSGSRQLTAAALAGGLVACGGGGGGDSAEAVVVDAPDKSETPISSTTVSQQQVQGSIRLPTGVTGDGENQFLGVNDAVRGDDNDSPFNAFGLANTATAVGAVCGLDEDVRDFFQASLNKDQWVTLQSTEATLGNADLFVYDQEMNLVTAGMSPTAQESVQIPNDGVYFIEVGHVADAADDQVVKYRLDLLPVGQQPSPDLLAAAGYSVNANMIPGQLIVTMRDESGVTMPQLVNVDVSGQSVLKSASLSAPLAVKNMLGAASAIASYDHKTAERRSMIRNADTRQAFDTLVQARLLESFDDVVSAEPDQILYATSLSTVNDSEADQQWGAELIDVEAAWSATTGAGVTVAVLDTAFLPEHPDLAGRMQQGYDFVDHDTDVSATATLEIQHGTHVAGIVGAARNNGMFTSGVAPGSTLMPLRVLGDCLCGSLGGIIQGLRYAAGLPNDSGTVPVQKAKVANLSLQLPYGRNAALLQTLEDVTAAGMTVVWAAGNESDRNSYDEAGVTGVPGVVVVNAVGSFQKLSGFSNFGSAVDISAPGGDTEANNGGRMITSLDGRYMKNSWMYDTGRLQGTSQAAPFVAGVIALMASVWDDMTPAAVDAMIERGDLTRDLGLAGNDDYYGAGIVDAGRAVQAALAHVGRDVAEVNPKRIVAMPGEAAFGAAQDVIEIDLFSTDDSAPTLSMIYAPAWVTVSQSQTDRGYGIWTLRVNRDALTQENHEDVIQFSNGERQLVVPVSAHNPENSARSTGVGQVLVQFFDSQSGELVHEEYALAQANYSFEFASDDVPVGRYTIQASSDFDEDENYCEVGELCGQFGNNGETEVTVVAGQGLVFEVLLQLQ